LPATKDNNRFCKAIERAQEILDQFNAAKSFSGKRPVSGSE
jgi:hypothetical protein